MNIRRTDNVAGLYKTFPGKKTAPKGKINPPKLRDKISINNGKQSWGKDAISYGKNIMFKAAAGAVMGGAVAGIGAKLLGSLIFGPLGAAIMGIGGALLGATSGFLSGAGMAL